MSTIRFSVNELGWIASRFVASGACDFHRAMLVVKLVAESNARAFGERYSEAVNPDSVHGYDAIEEAALNILAKPENWLNGPGAVGVAYNCAEDANLSTPCEQLDGVSLSDALEPLELISQKWLDALERTATRKAENDEAFADEGPLPVVAWSEITDRAKAAGCARVIVAEFSVSESDSYSDYYGGRTARSVVIGFGKGKRENFRELRASAAAFPPAEYVAFDRVSVRVKPRENEQYRQRPQAWEDASGSTRFFRSIDEATTALAELHATHDECQPGYTGCVGFPALSQHRGVDFETASPENRENYSMGGGNYLGWSRYSGWTVSSQQVDYFANRQDSVEFFEAPAKIVGGKKIKAAPIVPAKPKKDAVQFPIWTKKGLLQKCVTETIDWPHAYRKPETAQKDVQRLAAMGVVAEVKQGRNARYYYVQLVNAEPIPKPVFNIPTQAERAEVQYAGWNRQAPQPAPIAAPQFDLLANC
jgi:hypothetical protein